jgi:hypothetical protein
LLILEELGHVMTTLSSGFVRSRREAARQIGLTEGALRFAEKAGRISPEPGGGYDMARVRAGLRNTADPARQREEPLRPAPGQPDAARAVPNAALAAAADTLREHGIPTARMGGGTGGGLGGGGAGGSSGGMSFADARTAHEILKAQERRLRLEERRGRVVDKTKALLLVHRLAKEERDAILAWPSRVAAVLAAELGVDPHRLQTTLDASLRVHLTERHDVRISVG